MSLSESSSRPWFEPLEAPPGLRLVDPIDGSQFTLMTPETVDPVSRQATSLPVPVDGAVSIDADAITTPYLVGVWIRDSDFNLVEQCQGGDTVAIGGGRHVLEFSSVQLKLYLGIEGPFEVDATGATVSIGVPDASDVVVGVRSYHEHPAKTITTSEDPRDVMTALSQFRGALKTTSPERSFPTLRGHPPLLEFGEKLSIPGGSVPADPSVTIEIPPRWDRIFPVVPLSYYLDAELVVGSTPLLDLGHRRVPLVDDNGFESRVYRVLRHVFALDCVTRTEGLYDVALRERMAIEDRVDLDFQALYDQPLAERTARYLDVPFEDVEPAVPKWKLTADIQPTADTVSVLPFLASDLANIRCADDEVMSSGVARSTPDVETFFGTGDTMVRGSPADLRSGKGAPSSSVSDRVFSPRPTDSLMHTFVGDGVPLGATKMTPDAFRRRLAYEPAETGRIRVDVVNNEAAMEGETSVSDVYGTQEWIDFDVTIHEELPREALADLLRTETDFLHYIGHVEDEGFRCTDGHLDAHSLSAVGVGAFLLNACQSYQQGRALVEAGALGGIVTLGNVPNPTATRIGKNVARLLNTGFSIATARSLLEHDEELASRYVVVGDGNASIVQSKSGGPIAMTVLSASETTLTIRIQGYPSPSRSIGGLRSWNVDLPVTNCINPVHIDAVDIEREAFQKLCELDNHPILRENELVWSAETDVSQF